jgi:hypothetical protein
MGRMASMQDAKAGHHRLLEGAESSERVFFIRVSTMRSELPGEIGTS